jgi:hypothetical protein
LEKQMFQLRNQFLIDKSRLDDPQLIDLQVEEALADDTQYMLLKKQFMELQMSQKRMLTQGRNAHSRSASTLNQQIAQINAQIQEYKAGVKAQIERDRRTKPNLMLQQLQKEFETNVELAQLQLAVINKALEEAMDALSKRQTISIDLQQRDLELKQLQEIANDMSIKLVALEGEKESSDSSADKETSRPIEVEQVPVGDENVTVVRGSKDDVNAFIKQAEEGENRETQNERRVLGKFPMEPYNPGKLLSAIDDARAQNLHVDMEYDADKVNLIAVPAPSEADWPEMLGNPPRKERVIADKAWERLGLKLMPASQLELFEFQSRRTAGPIKILGGNVPKGLPLPAFLWQVGENSLDSLEELHVWLMNQENQRPTPVKVYAFANGHEYLFDAGPSESEELALAQEPKSKFPSLEDQKLADLAWRMLQLELEPAGDDELKNVRALGYQGGVMVSGTARSDGRPASYNEIHPGDILVGLHVWPTSSLKDVAAILTRDDLADLSPLKFYVVRGEELVVTGRISVRSPGTQPGGARPPAATETGGENPLTARGYAAIGPERNESAAASESEINVLLEHIKTLQSQFDQIDALFKAGRRGGRASTRALAAYELAVAKGELALMQGQRAQAIASFNEAQSQAQDAFKAMSADYEAGNVPYEVMLLTAKNLADIKRKFIQLQQQRTGSNRAAAVDTTSTAWPKGPEGAVAEKPQATSAAPEPNQPSSSNKRRDAGVTIAAESQEALNEFMRLAASPQPSESMSVLKKMVEREKQKLDYMIELARNGKVPAAEAETQKANLEISIQRLRQAERALEYHRALVQLHAAEYEAALESNRLAPRSVSDSELRKLRLKVQLAEAKYKELAE